MPHCELNCHFLIQSKYSLVGSIDSDLTAESTQGQRELAKLADTFRLTGCNFSRRPNAIRRGRLDLEKVGGVTHIYLRLQRLFRPRSKLISPLICLSTRWRFCCLLFWGEFCFFLLAVCSGVKLTCRAHRRISHFDSLQASHFFVQTQLLVTIRNLPRRLSAR